MKCRIINGGEKILSPNNTPSELYEELKNIFGKNRALNLYLLTETEDFNTYKASLNIEGEPSMEELISYSNRLEPDTFTKPREIIELMRSLNIQESSDFVESMEKAKDQGVFLLTRENLRRTRLFDEYTIDNILTSKESQKTVLDVYKTLSNSDSISIQPNGIFLENSSELTKEGTVKQRNKDEGNTTVYSVKNGEIVERRSKETERLERVITFQPNLKLAEASSFLRDYVSPTAWRMSKDIQALLKEIRLYAQDNGIDLNGLEDTYGIKTRAEVINLVDSLEDTLSGEMEIGAFVGVWEEYFDKRWVEDRNLPDTDIVVYEIDEQMMLDTFSLIKVGENVWRRVPKIDIKEFVGDNFTEIGAYKILLGVNEVRSFKDVSKLREFSGDYEYLSTNFESDFGKYLLRTDNTNFVIDEKGIQIKQGVFTEDALASITNEEILENLEQYSLISKNLELPLQYTELVQLNEFQLQRDLFANNPHTKFEFNAEFQMSDDMVYTKDYSDQFMNFKGVPFELVYQEGEFNFYMPLEVSNGNIMNLGVSKPVVTKLVKGITSSNTGVSIKEVENNNGKYFECL